MVQIRQGRSCHVFFRSSYTPENCSPALAGACFGVDWEHIVACSRIRYPNVLLPFSHQIKINSLIKTWEPPMVHHYASESFTSRVPGMEPATSNIGRPARTLWRLSRTAPVELRLWSVFCWNTFGREFAELTFSGWWFGRHFFLFSHEYGEFYNPNWRTPSFFRGVALAHQPVFIYPICSLYFSWGIGSKAVVRCSAHWFWREQNGCES